MADFYQKSLQQPHAQNAFLQTPGIHGLYPMTIKDQSGVSHRVNKHPVVKIETDVTSRQNAISPIQGNLYDGGEISFRIEKGTVDVLDHIYYRYDLQNNAVGSITVNAAPLSLNYVQIYAQNGADLLVQESGLSLWLSLCASLSRNEFETIAPQIGSNSTYARNAVIAAGATENFYIPLTRLFHQARICLQGLSSELIIRFLFNPASQNVSGQTPTCTNSFLLLRGSYEPAQVTNERIKIYRSPTPLTVQYLHPMHMSETLSMTASSNYSITLSGIKGMAAMLFVTVRQSPLPAVAAGNFLTGVIDKLDVQNASGESVLGHYQIQYDEIKTLTYAEKFDNLFSNNSGFVVIPFSKSPMQTLKDASNHGFQPFTGFEKLFISTTSNLSSATYTVDIVGYVYSTAHIQNSTIRTRKP